MKNKILSKEEQAVVDAMRVNIELKECFLEMIGITHERIKELNKGDDAEEAVVSAIQKTGKVLLQEWAEKKNKEAETIARKESLLRPHEKKN